MIHSKVMVVDDRFLRVGSANINNRSMGADTECDLAIEARNDRGARAPSLRIRNRLLGEHCGVAAADVAAALARHGSLVRAADELSANGHSLRPIDDGEPDDRRPCRRHRAHWPIRRSRSGRRGWPPSAGAPAAAARGPRPAPRSSSASRWRGAIRRSRSSPTADNVRAVLKSVRGEPWAVVVVVLVFVLAGVIVFPLNVLILTTAAVFGPWLGILYGGAGAWRAARDLTSSARWLGREALDRMMGAALAARLEGVRKRGLLAVVTFRLLPIAPFTLVNIAAGASGIRFVDFLVGTLIGMLPGLALMSVMGDRIVRILAEPSAGDIAILVVCVAALIGLAVAAQALLSRRGDRA